MTQVTAGAAKAKIARHATSPSDLPNMETPKAFHEIAEKGVAHAEETYEKAKVAAEQTTDFLKNAHTTAAKGATDYNLKVLEIARINTNTAFDYAQELLGVKSLPEFVEVSTAHARKQSEVMTAQTKELAEFAVKVATEIAEPLRTGMSKAFNIPVA
jgi:phasin